MTEKEVFQMVKSIGLPAAYHHFDEGQSPEPPFVVYLYPGTNNFLRMERYIRESISLILNFIPIKRFRVRKRVEAVLKKARLFL